MKKKDTTYPNNPILWAFHRHRYGPNASPESKIPIPHNPTPNEWEEWIRTFQTGEEAWENIRLQGPCWEWTGSNRTRTPTEVIASLLELRNAIPVAWYNPDPANSGRAMVAMRLLALIDQGLVELQWLEANFPNPMYTLDDVFMMIRRHPPKTWGTTLDTFLDTIESYGYTGSLIDEEIDYLQTWKPKLEQEAMKEIDRRFAAMPTEYSTEKENAADTVTPERSSKPLTITGIVERELSNYSVDLSDADAGNSIRDKYPDIVGDKDSWRCAVRDRRKKLRGKSGDPPERK